MRRFFVLILFTAATFVCCAQNAEFGRLTITPYIAPESGFDASASRLLQEKLAYAVSLANASGGFDKRFVITPKVDILQSTTTATIPQKVSLRAQFTFYVGDGVDGTLFSSCQKEVTGIGDTEKQAVLSAIRKINAKDKELQETITEGRERIEEYYKKMAPKIFAEARSLISSYKYEEAIAALAVIPRSCGDYEKAQEMMAECVSASVENANNELLVKARSAWSASPDEAGASEAAAYLADITNPSAKVTAAVNKLTAEMEARISDMAKRRLAVKKQRIISAENVRKEEIRATERVVGRIIDAYTPVYRVARWF